MHYLILNLIAWFPMIVLAVVNGGIREYTYQKWTGEKAGHQISSATLVMLITVYCFFLFRYYPVNSLQEGIYTGAMWLILSMVFEFIMGLLNGSSWSVMLADYNIIKGRLWPLVLLWISMAPVVFYYISIR